MKNLRTNFIQHTFNRTVFPLYQMDGTRSRRLGTVNGKPFIWLLHKITLIIKMTLKQNAQSW